MTQWQFLIQKEGDQDWLPLDSPNVEILEGRYCLMAQGDRLSTQVEVQIRHEYDLEGVPQEVTQRRRQQTDAQGLLALFSLTYLPPGLWELQCQANKSQNQADNTPPQKLFLQVLAQDFELLSDWDSPEPSFDSVFPIEALIANPAEQTFTAAAASVKPPRAFAPAAVQLPSIPKDIAPLSLRLSDPLSLPPMLYSPAYAVDEAAIPQLPEFLPSGNLFSANVLIHDLKSSLPQTVTSPPLPFLQSVVPTTDRQKAYKAFESLAQRQRFLKTLNTLMQDSLSSQDLVALR
jgi:hypothetical protein